MRGKLIALEGCDRIGKTTQVSILKNIIPNAVTMKFPTRQGSPTGEKINNILQGKIKATPVELQELFRNDRLEQTEKIKKIIEEGKNVIVDRYSFSGIVFATVNGVSKEKCISDEINIYKPDIVIYLYTDNLSELSDRNDYGNEIFENIEFQEKVHKEFIKYINKNWIIINVSGLSIEKVTDEIIKKLKKI